MDSSISASSIIPELHAEGATRVIFGRSIHHIQYIPLTLIELLCSLIKERSNRTLHENYTRMQEKQKHLVPVALL